MSARNLQHMFDQADDDDYSEGLLAYYRYNMVMRDLAHRYKVDIAKVIAAFCATSPNNDYVGNLRSVASILDAFKSGRSFDTVQISTYRHCGARAWSYVEGTADFVTQVRGLKILNFYHNVLHPSDNRYVTIDGHMVAAYRGQNLTMKEAICRTVREYEDIALTTKALAFNNFLLPNQYQAIVWFARKRVFNIKYDGRRDMFLPRDDLWRTLRNVDEIVPFPPRQGPSIKDLKRDPLPPPLTLPLIA